MYDDGYMVVEPTTHLCKVHCTVCDLWTASESRSNAVVSAYQHVVRTHPDVYARVVGHAPRPEEVAQTMYGLLEGLVPITEVGPFNQETPPWQQNG